MPIDQGMKVLAPILAQEKDSFLGLASPGRP
jgi:hypothetical protein